jgi:DNA-binding NarL/FixJ family response regulator
MPSVLIADDHGLYRRGLQAALQTAWPGARIKGVSTLPAALAELALGDSFDIALLDLTMPGVQSIEDLRAARRAYPRTRFVVLSGSDAIDDVLGALAAGLHGYISKSQSDEEIMEAVSDVLSGRIYVPPWLAQPRAVPSHDRHASVTSDPGDHGPGLAGLTPRQQEVLFLLAKGLSNKEIANKLAIAEPTTKIHVAALMRTLHVRNRTEAALFVKTWLRERE